VRVHGQLLIGPNVEQSTGCVVRTGGECLSIREECHRIDIGLMAGEGLFTDALTYVPELGRCIAGARDERFALGRQREGHHIAGVSQKRGDLQSRLNVPQAARHITGTGHDLIVVQEAAAR